MEKLWQFLMRANARALFVGALAALVVVAGWRGWVELFGAEAALPEEHATGRAEFKPGPPLGLKEFAAAQLAWAGAIPACPFLPTLEAMAADPAAATVMADRGSGRQWRGFQPPRDGGKDPFAHLRGERTLPVDNSGNGTPAGVTRLTYKGFFRGPDGRAAALFHDSARNAGFFARPGDSLNGATLLAADIHSAKVRLHDDEIILERNDHIDVKPESSAP